MTLFFLRQVGAHDPIFQYPVPMLEELILLNRSALRAPVANYLESIFVGKAPNLRALILADIELPAACPAFSSVKSATIQAPGSGISGLFALLPSVEWLSLMDLGYHRSLPAVPVGSPLSWLNLSGTGFDLDRIEEAGTAYRGRGALLVSCASP